MEPTKKPSQTPKAAPAAASPVTPANATTPSSVFGYISGWFGGNSSDNTPKMPSVSINTQLDTPDSGSPVQVSPTAAATAINSTSSAIAATTAVSASAAAAAPIADATSINATDTSTINTIIHASKPPLAPARPAGSNLAEGNSPKFSPWQSIHNSAENSPLYSASPISISPPPTLKTDILPDSAVVLPTEIQSSAQTTSPKAAMPSATLLASISSPLLPSSTATGIETTGQKAITDQEAKAGAAAVVHAITQTNLNKLELENTELKEKIKLLEKEKTDMIIHLQQSQQYHHSLEENIKLLKLTIQKLEKDIEKKHAEKVELASRQAAKTNLLPDNDGTDFRKKIEDLQIAYQIIAEQLQRETAAHQTTCKKQETLTMVLDKAKADLKTEYERGCGAGKAMGIAEGETTAYKRYAEQLQAAEIHKKQAIEAALKAAEVERIAALRAAQLNAQLAAQRAAKAELVISNQNCMANL